MRRRPATAPAWATGHETYGPGSGCFTRDVPFGQVLWDGTRRSVEIREYYGPRVLGRGLDPYNPWRNPRAQGSLRIGDAAPAELREAAAALIEAAAVIEGKS
ncbi:hypothetical protein [Actinotalea fermentans]|uniref:Uncharacterized protein n=1 Tax=Actinotalea fermentans TaxID=43671 RepID=A0A511YU50_9CELL|nr:hypothetical protein [Actinotalea fermentans]KGM17171.1 hypothetical protein N867_09190 [Actinotalea fermentans ATCC 43279 = JCM 9966 = DSM 3133]GEN78715.1 hypothetical protein AFE02nite_04490 [Actinotalea fermentans]